MRSIIYVSFVGFQVLKAVFVKSSVFWDTTPSNPLEGKDLNGIHNVVSQNLCYFAL
jgi:hypothetical protein